MSDRPRAVRIHEEGPREGFQIEPGPIATADKIALVDALSSSGVRKIQVASFVNPKRVPGWVDADAVVRGFEPRAGVEFTALWLNAQGLERAVQHRDKLALRGSISMCASEPFLMRNQNRNFEQNLVVQRDQIAIFRQHGIEVDAISVMAAFGCNFAGDIPLSALLTTIADAFAIAEESDITIREVRLADSMAWANPDMIRRFVGGVRDKWPHVRVSLHLHDTRGLGIANAYAGLDMGVDTFDSSVAGLGGCPFAGHKGAAGNVCTEDLVFMCEEMGIATGIDLEQLVAAAQLAERIVGHPLPGSVMHGGSLRRFR